MQNIPIPLTLDGVYLNISTSTDTGSYPSDWTTQPFINPFYGGVAIATSDLFRPVITGADQIVNVSYGTAIDGSLNYAAGENGSSTHVGSGPGQFILGTDGYIAFEFQTSVSSPAYYGWSRLSISNTGEGIIRDWAYSDDPFFGLLTGTLFATPEPSRSALLLLSCSLLIYKRRRLVW